MMTNLLRCLIVESEPPGARRARRDSVGCSAAETYKKTLKSITACECVEVRPAEGDGALPMLGALEGYDAIFMTGSPLHLYEDSRETRRQVDFMRAIFASGTPSFGSCAGLQVATVAAGGTVRPNARGREVDFARRILKTSDGRDHPLLRGRPDVYDAPAVHGDEVDTLPTGAIHLASNRVTEVQAAEVRSEGGVFWGVQYHPELSLAEVAAALRRSRTDLINEGYADTGKDLEAHASLIEELHEEPGRRDLAWRLGLDEQVTEERERVRELRNFIEHLALPTRSARGRG
jgi:GMP synthase (glutamine-hydrolysing)